MKPGGRLLLHQFLDHARDALSDAAIAVAVPLPFFVALAFAVKGRRLFQDVHRALPESRLNLLIHFTDALLVAPLLLVMSVAMHQAFQAYGLVLVPTSFWERLHPIAVGLVAVFLGDFIGYWRHRFEHTPLMWPAHAVHHSDEEMTWLSIFRFHPINRLTTTAIDFAFILAMGLPPYAVLVNSLVRHYYGAFIHADLPWTYGPLGRIFVSPAMHRWHHAMDVKAYNTNYATVFSLFDRAFGTFRVPGPCITPLGVPEGMGEGIAGQMAHPFRPSSYRYFLRSVGRLRHRRA
jgi:sterol desaturase/sphingolipid hydroxylase (fatty acid hydroxylase superfamily)